MRLRLHRHPASAKHSRAFSLIELSVVIAILSVVATLGLEAAANFVNRSAGTLTRERLAVVDDAIVRYFRIYGRLPCPANRTTPLANNQTTFGIEDCTIPLWDSDPTVSNNYTVKYGGGLLAGMVPIRTLNLPLSYATDGFGNKLNYVVTKNLTVAGGNVNTGAALIKGRFGSFDNGTPPATDAPETNGIGGIEIRTGQLEQPCGTNCQILANPSLNPPTGAAYIVFSNGSNQRGAIPPRSTSTAINCATTPLRVDDANCKGNVALICGATCTTNIAKNVFYDNRYNAGLNLRNYFDDFVIWRSKAQL